MSTRKVNWRGECPSCYHRQKVNKTTKTIGSHWAGGGDTYCPGIGLPPVEGTVREYIAKPKVEITYTPPPEPRFHPVYKAAMWALLALLFFAAFYFVGEVVAQ